MADRAFSGVELRSLQAGVPKLCAQGVTRALADRVIGLLAAGQVVQIYPGGMFDVVLELAAAGADGPTVAIALTEADANGELRDRSMR
ncbi:MAG: hypothetical protein ACI9MC_004053 [Kiritimatiellia bacterium]|jgi:hypothetical protein